ncbi:MAG TPA: hypothetical protein VIM58_06115 [Candidatus Methylacidiphilales bacterium]
MLDRLASPKGLLALGVALVILGLLRGYPMPYPDDLFFIGAGLELARGGPLENPLIQGWMSQFGTHAFFVQPPFYAYEIAAWVRLWGVSALSLAAFQAAALLVGVFFWCAFLRRLGVRGAMLLVWTAAGLLPAWGTMLPGRAATAFQNVALFLLAGGGTEGALAAGLCLGLAVGTYVGTVATALPLGAAALFVGVRGRGGRAAAKAFAACVAGGLLSVVLLGWGIDWQWGEFVRVFRAHVALRRPPFLEGLAIFVRQFVQYGQWLVALPSLLLAAGITAVAVIRRPRSGKADPLLFVIAALFAAMAFNVVLYAQSAALTCEALMPVAALVAVSLDRQARAFRWGSIVLLFVVSHVLQFREVFTEVSFARTGVPAETAAAWRARAERAPVCVVDSNAARYVFDYRLPPNARDWMYVRPPPGYGWPTQWKAEDGAVWIGDRAFLSHVPGSPVPPLKEEDYFHLGSRRLGVPKRMEIVCIGGEPEAPAPSGGKP